MKKLLISILIVFAWGFNYAQWQQIGQNISASSMWSDMGYAVSINADATVMAVSDLNGRGKVYIYDNIDGAWVQRGPAITGGKEDNTKFGSSLSLSDDGTILAVGDFENKFGVLNGTGRVLVFQQNGDSWEQIGTDILGEAEMDESATSISLSGDGTVLAIGAPENDGNGGNAGHTRVYKLNNNVWVQMGSDIDGETQGDRSGSAVCLSKDGTTLIVGEPYNDDGYDPDAGQVRVYKFTEATSSWVQKGQDINGTYINHYLGQSVSINTTGDVIAVGIPGTETAAGTFAGEVRVYKFENNLWEVKGSPIQGKYFSNELGSSVSLSDDGSVVACGAGAFGTLGKICAYQFMGTDWVAMGNPVTGADDGDNLGVALDLSADGTTFVAGSPERYYACAYHFEMPDNTAPIFTSYPVKDVDPGTKYLYDITASDVDGDPLQISLTQGLDWLSITDNGDGTARMSGTPEVPQAGTYPITLTVSDGELSSEQNFNLVVIAPANESPEFTTKSLPSSPANANYETTVMATDPEGDKLTITAKDIPQWLILRDNGDGTATIKGYIPLGTTEVDIILTVSDGEYDYDGDYTIKISEGPVNNAPQFNTNPVTEAQVDVVYIYQVEASDVEGEPLSYKVKQLPSWLQLDDKGSGTAVIVGTPRNEHAGNHEISFTISDGVNTTEQTFTLVVSGGTSGIAKMQDSFAKVFPNPSSGTMYIQLTKYEKGAVCEVIDLNGKVIMQNAITSLQTALHIQKPGLYILRISNSKETQTSKIRVVF